jgi:hypothetical protein
VGFPIRKSTDQRVFAPPRSLSQRITSFIACACQGIHQLPLRHLIVLIANAHLRNPKDCRFSLSLAGLASAQFQRNCRLNQILCGIQFDVIGTKRPASRDRFEGAVRQTHHMQEIERLLRQITNLSAHEVRTNLLFTMSKQNKRQAKKLTTNLYTNDFFPSSLLDTSSRRQSLRIARRWWSRTGSNRRHPACKAGALPAELRPLIVFLTMQRRWWAWEDLNLRPHAYQARALTN